MSNESEVILPEGGAVEVSSVAQEAAPKKRIKDMTPEEKKLYNREAQKKSRPKQKERKQAASFVYDSDTLPTKPEAKKILADRGLRNPHVIDVCYELALQAAEHADVPANRFLFQNGIAKMLESYDKKEPQALPPVSEEAVVGELNNHAELVAIHDYSIAWREDAFDFPEFLRLRRVCKTDAYELGLMLGKDWEVCQKNWAEFLPRFNPDTLPPNYTQRQMREWLASTCEVKDYLLLASRNSMKSSFSLNWLLTLHLCCPDARALLCSETKKLSAGFIRSYRSMWEVKPNNESKMQILFPEYCIAPGEGSTLEFSSPMAHLDLIQASATSTSAESAVTGGRAEVLLCDDIISNLTCGTEEQCQKSVDLFDLLSKLREVLGSFSIVIGTPWKADIDLYAVLLKRSEEDGGSLAFRMDPVVTLKRTAQHKLTPQLLTTITQEDVESYLLPVRMPWRWIKSEITKNPTFALSQNFIVFPKAEDDDLRVTFEEDDLISHTRSVGHFETPTYTKCLSLDRAWSLSKFADFSCLTVGTVQQVKDKTAVVIRDVRMDRWKESELVKAVCDMIEKHRDIKYVVAERDRGYEQLGLSILRMLQMRGIPAPHFVWKPIPAGIHNDRMKAKRAKKLELPLKENRLWFVAGDWNEFCFKQLCDFNGLIKSNSTRKDDFVDTLGLFWETFGPKYDLKDTAPVDPEEQARVKQENEELAQQERLRHHHQRMFNDGASSWTTARQYDRNNEPPPEPAAPPPQSPRDAAMQQLIKILPPSMRRRSF